MKRLLLGVLFGTAAWAACHSIGSKRWYCPSSGNPEADGTDARTFISGAASDGSEPGRHLQYACGDTIILDSGATYDTMLKHYGPPYGDVSLPYFLSANCGSNKVKIVGTRAAELPQGYRPQMSDIPRMVKLRLSLGANYSDCGVLCTSGVAASGYYLDGLVLTTNHDYPAVARASMAPAMLSLQAPAPGQDNLPHDIEFHHILVTNAEQELFGPLENCKTIECTLRGNSIGIHFAGVNVVLEDSAVYGLGGFLPSFGGVLSASVFGGSGGSGYAVFDTFKVNGGTDLAIGVVDSVGAGGSVSAMHFTRAGWGYTSGNRGGYGWGTTATSGGGSGLLLFVNAGNTTYPVTGGTNADPTVITSPGISALLGIYPERGAHCTNPVTGKPQCTYQCAYYDKPTPSCAMVIVEGTPRGWDAAAGVKFAIYKTADSVSLVPATFDEQLSPSGGTVDTTSAPAWSGTARIRSAGEGTKLDPVYNLVTDSVDNVRVVNSYFENGDMTVFGSGGSFPTSTGTVTASTFNPATQISTVTVTNVVGDAKVGDILAAAAPGISKWCGPTGGSTASNNCYQGGTRSGKIRAISGTRPTLTFSMLPVGPQGIDCLLTTGKVAQWEGLNPSRISMIRNRIVRSPDAFPTGKGPFESKACDTCLFDGNSVDGVIFFETKNQWSSEAQNGPPNAAVPWTTLNNVTVRNNNFWVGGRATINANDYEATTTQAKNAWFENNFFAGGGAGWEQQNNVNSGFRHNTVAGPDPSSAGLDPAIFPPNYINDSGIPLPCGHRASDGMPYLDDYDKLYGLIYDNIVPYNHGLAHGDTGCWPNEATAVHHNVFIQGVRTGDPGATAINSSWPHNMPVANLAGVGMVNPGTLCTKDNWKNCALGPSSSFKGRASDGKDPGADILEVQDHQNGWSEAAGLIRYENLTATYEQNPAAFNLGAKHAAITFQQYGAPCSLVLYTDRARQIIHGDTSTSGRQDCTREGNLNQDGLVTFVLGTNVALDANTLYAYQITTGDRVMVGEFRTAAAEPVGTISLQLGDSTAADARIEYAASADLSGSSLTAPVAFVGQVATPLASLSGVKYYRWLKRDNTGRVLSQGPVAVAFRP